MAITPEDISIKGLYKADPGFSARFDARERTYRYRIACGNAQPVLAWDHCWWLRSELDVDSMAQAAAPLMGEHDFTSFCKVSSSEMLKSQGRSTSRHLKKISVERVMEAGEELVVVEVTGNAFLHNMIRIIVGTLVEVGTGHRSITWPEEVLMACDRRAAGPTAPACGLVFEDVRYAPGALVSLI
jgi:tRNA pseudouridine38-40 synthase